MGRRVYHSRFAGFRCINTQQDIVDFLTENPGYYSETELFKQCFGFDRNNMRPMESNKKYADLLRRAWAKGLVDRRVKAGTTARYEWFLVTDSDSGKKNFSKLLQNRNNGQTFTSMIQTHKPMEFTNTERSILASLQGNRKPYDASDLTIMHDWDDLVNDAKKALLKLPVYTEAQLDISSFTDNIGAELAQAQYFIITTEGKDTYLVDTQGFAYCRYVAVIKNFNQKPVFDAELSDTPLVMQNVRVLVATIPQGKLYIECMFHITVGAQNLDVELVDSYLSLNDKMIHPDNCEKFEFYLEVQLGCDIKSIFRDAETVAEKLVRKSVKFENGKLLVG